MSEEKEELKLFMKWLREFEKTIGKTLNNIEADLAYDAWVASSKNKR